MNYLETVGKNAKEAFEDLKDVKHKKIKKVLDNYNQSLLKNSNKIIRENINLSIFFHHSYNKLYFVLLYFI